MLAEEEGEDGQTAADDGAGYFGHAERREVLVSIWGRRKW